MTAVSTDDGRVEVEVESLRRRYRDVIGRFATGVTVVTWMDGDDVLGMTANAVSSVSLDPILVLVCVDRKTAAHAQLETSSTFAINILAHSQEHVSNAFARHSREGALEVAMRQGETGVPIVEGALAWMECEISERLPGGDHTIYLGEVKAMGVNDDDVAPLLFYGGRYDRLGSAVQSD